MCPCVPCVSRLPPVSFYRFKNTGERRDFVKSSQVSRLYINIKRKPIECAPEASSGGREWAEMTGGVHIEATRRKVLTYVPSVKK